jgi:hypothetical protein
LQQQQELAVESEAANVRLQRALDLQISEASCREDELRQRIAGFDRQITKIKSSWLWRLWGAFRRK